MNRYGTILEWPLGTLDFSHGPVVMGVLNVTPDSFSDGGMYFETDAAVMRGLEMVEQGAGIIDIGPESSRPGSRRVEAIEQIRRSVPIIEKLADQITVPISIDTYLPEVARAALDAGAAMVNDITAMGNDTMATLAADRRAAVVLMHMQGDPATMQADPHYEDVTTEVLDFLLTRAQKAEQAGIPPERIFIDPGIGFGKTTRHNLQLLHDIDRFTGSGYPVLAGTSRKRFIGEITRRKETADRIFGTAATVAHCAGRGVAVVRVHDVAGAVDVVRMITAIERQTS
ncbi:MAG: dihydropteroate synthase [Sedimentisphaerales bacterium]|nr:dihydropteroate synthase [Sedimentisphaerales bacterium]